jgi:hypothetical protein
VDDNDEERYRGGLSQATFLVCWGLENGAGATSCVPYIKIERPAHTGEEK